MRRKFGAKPIIQTLAVGYPSITFLGHYSHCWAQLVYAAFIAAFSSALANTPVRYYRANPQT